MTSLDTHISQLAEKYTPLARQFLAEAIRIPADYVDKSEKDVCYQRFSLSFYLLVSSSLIHNRVAIPDVAHLITSFLELTTFVE